MGRGEEESRFIGCERGNQRKKKRNTGMTRNKNERYVVKEKKDRNGRPNMLKSMRKKEKGGKSERGRP